MHRWDENIIKISKRKKRIQLPNNNNRMKNTKEEQDIQYEAKKPFYLTGDLNLQ